MRDDEPIRVYAALAWRARWALLAVTAAVTAATWVLTLPRFKTPEFRATASFIIPSFRAAKSLTFLKQEFQGYGVALPDEMDQMEAALQSEDAFRYMVARFDLVRHYGLAGETSGHIRNKKLREWYEDKIQLSARKNAIIEVKVLDTDPVLAADIANAYISYTEDYVERISRRKRGLTELNKSIYNLRTVRNDLEDSLAHFRKRLGIYQLDNLAEALSADMTRDMFQDTTFYNYYSRLISLETRMRYLELHLARMFSEKNNREENLQAYPSLVNATFASPSRIIARPNRPVLIIAATIAAFLMALGVLLLTHTVIYPPAAGEFFASLPNPRRHEH